MIKKQFTKGGIDLKGQTLGNFTTIWGYASIGVCFPKIKANNVTVTLYTKSHYNSSSGSRNFQVRYFVDGVQTLQENRSCRYNLNNADTPTTYTITDGRIMDQIIMNGTQYDPAARAVMVVFNDVEYVN